MTPPIAPDPSERANLQSREHDLSHARRTGRDGERELPAAGGAAQSDDSPQPFAEAERPRLIEEHTVRGRHGEDELEATDERGRRWYHIRPEPRGRADFVGFNYTWWIMLWALLLFIVFFPWGGGWGY